MIAWTLENTWLPIPMRKGGGNGYVAIPKSHPLYGLSIEELSDISLGLSVTLSEPIKYWEEKEIPELVATIQSSVYSR